MTKDRERVKKKLFPLIITMLSMRTPTRIRIIRNGIVTKEIKKIFL